jgi:hypothetical protein
MTKTIKVWLTAFFFLFFTACQPGSTLNPLKVSSRTSLTVKAGSTVSLMVSLGNASNLGLNPADLYRNASVGASLSGMVSTAVVVNTANLSNSNVPIGWKLEMGGEFVELLAYSSSTYGFDTINTFTRVELGDHRIGASLSVPGNAAVGTYSVRARVDVRGKNPVMLEWIVQVVAP